jgi:hypothetical protein
MYVAPIKKIEKVYKVEPFTDGWAKDFKETKLVRVHMSVRFWSPDTEDIAKVFSEEQWKSIEKVGSYDYTRNYMSEWK